MLSFLDGFFKLNCGRLEQSVPLANALENLILRRHLCALLLFAKHERVLSLLPQQLVQLLVLEHPNGPLGVEVGGEALDLKQLLAQTKFLLRHRDNGLLELFGSLCILSRY